jgi:hypothetical protein
MTTQRVFFSGSRVRWALIEQGVAELDLDRDRFPDEPLPCFREVVADTQANVATRVAAGQDGLVVRARGVFDGPKRTEQRCDEIWKETQ